MTLRTISLWQPWARACVTGVKKNETRHWPTSYRGRLFIHAAKKWNKELALYCANPLVFEALAGTESEGIGHLPQLGLEFGAVIGHVDLVDCVQMKDLPAPSPLEHLFGHWDDEGCRYAWIFENPVRFAAQVPCKGQQGFWNLQGEAEEQVQKELDLL